MRKKNNITGYAFLTPNLIGFLILTLIPVAAAFLLCFFDWNLFNAPRFVGFQNFIDLFGFFKEDGEYYSYDPKFWKYLWNTFFYMLGIPVSMSLSLLLAIVLNQKIRGRVLFRTIFHFPTICSGIGIMLLWMWIYDPEFGPINRGLATLGITGPMWLKSYHWAKPAIMIMGFWGGMGGVSMLLYLAGLQNIPLQLYEAAEIDGAGAVRKFFHITLPMLRPTTFFIFVTSVIGGFQGGFQSAYIMTKGGPNGATTTIGYYIYQNAFQWFNMGYAATIAVVLFAIVFMVTMMNWKYGGQGVSGDA